MSVEVSSFPSSASGGQDSHRLLYSRINKALSWIDVQNRDLFFRETMKPFTQPTEPQQSKNGFFLQHETIVCRDELSPQYRQDRQSIDNIQILHLEKGCADH